MKKIFGRFLFGMLILSLFLFTFLSTLRRNSKSEALAQENSLGKGREGGENDWRREYYRKLYYPHGESLTPSFLQGIWNEAHRAPDENSLLSAKARKYAIERVNAWQLVG